MSAAFFRPVLGVMLRYFYLLRGTPARWMPIFAWVAIDIVLWGFISRYLNSVAVSRLNFVPALLGRCLLFDFFTGSCMESPGCSWRTCGRGIS